MKMIEINKWLYSSFLVVLLCIVGHFVNILPPVSFRFETSVWCFKGLNQSNICKFKNVCYDLHFKTFLFFLDKGSVIKGFYHYSDLQKIQLSSVQPHNQFYANFSVINGTKYKATKELKIHLKVLLLSRFKPNNIMHTVHDDLFPMFLTLESHCLGSLKCMESYSLMFHDNHPKGPFFQLYNLFSSQTPILSKELNVNSNLLLCFEEMLTGLVLDGVFYQYGFKRPHGPVKSIQLTQSDISRFTAFITKKLGIYETKRTNSEIILFSRQKSRKILNIIQLKGMIQTGYQKLNKTIKVKLINLDLFSQNPIDLIKVISESDGLIGMHGAEMILSLFMKPGSYVFEIFPFGINPDTVSFIKPISELEGSNLFYFSWRNMLRSNSVAHPNAHPLFGGIAHLDKRTQKVIEAVDEVPPVECCSKPIFLYYMYQDTWISSDFRNFFYKSVLKTFVPLEPENIIRKWFYPYKVINVMCRFELQRRLLHISWHPPFNEKNMTSIKYSLYIREKRGFFNKDISSDKLTLQIEIPVNDDTAFEIWISAYYIGNGSKGPDSYLQCP